MATLSGQNLWLIPTTCLGGGFVTHLPNVSLEGGKFYGRRIYRHRVLLRPAYRRNILTLNEQKAAEPLSRFRHSTEAERENPDDNTRLLEPGDRYRAGARAHTPDRHCRIAARR